MDYTLDQLYAMRDAMTGGRQAPAPADPPDGQGFFNRLGRTIGNYVTDIPNDGVSVAGNLVDFASGAPAWVREQHQREIAQSAQEARPFEVPQAREGSISDLGADVIGGLGKTVAEAYMVGGPVTRGAQLLGAGRAAPILGDIAGGAFVGLTQSPGEGAATGAEFGAIGAANQFIPNPWLKAAANIAVPVTGQLLRGRDPLSKESLVSTGANVAVPALLGQYARRGEPLLRRANGDPNFTMGAGTDPRWMPEGAPESRAIVPVESSPVYIGPGNGFTMQGDGIQTIYPRPIGEQYAPPPQEPLALPAPRRLLQAPQAIIPGAEPARQAIPSEVFSDPRSRLGEEGSVSQPLLQYMGSGAAGAVAGPFIDDDPNKPLLARMAEGAALGLGARALGPQLLRLTRFDPEGRLGMLGVPEGRKWWQRPAEAPKEFTPEEYARLADERWATKSKTTPTAPTAEEASAIRTAYSEARSKSDFPAVAIADVLERAGFTPETMDRGRGIIAAMRQSGDVNVSSGDWSASGPRERAWSIDLFDSSPSNPQPKQLLMRMEDAPKERAPVVYRAENGEKIAITPSAQEPGKYQATYILSDGEPAGHLTADSIQDAQRRVEARDPEIFGTATPEFRRETGGMLRKSNARAGSTTLYDNPAVQYGLGAAAGAAVAPVVDQDPNHPLGAKMLLGAIGGAGAVAGGRRLLLSPAATQSAAAQSGTAATPARGPGLLQGLKQAALDQERGKPSPTGRVVRRLQMEFGLGRTEAQNLAEQQALGAKQDFINKAREIDKPLLGASQVERDAMAKFEASDGGAAAEAAFRASVRPEIHKAYMDAEAHESGAQRILADADPSKKPLLDATEGKWRTRKFSAFNDPAEWERQKAANPKLREDYIDRLMNDNSFPGFDRAEVDQALGQWETEIQRGGTGYETGSGSKISQRLYQHRKDLSKQPELRAYLGEYTNPVQRIVFSQNKLASSLAQAKLISNLVERGQRGELDVMTLEQRRAALAAAQAKGDTARAEQLRSLYLVSKDTPGLGKLAGMVVPRPVADAMNLHGQLWDGGWLKGAAPLTQLMKTNMTVLNPGTHGRNWLQMLFLGAVARVHPGDMWAAARAIRERGSDWEKLVRNNIVGADFSTAELDQSAKALDTLFNPNKGQQAFGVLKTAFEKVKHAYALPDQILRAAAYLKHEPRFLSEGNAAGLKGAELARYVEDKTTSFVNRYTQNYSMRPNAVKVLGQTPFVTPFLSYQFTMGRIIKNLAEDAISGNAHDRAWAIANLGGLIALPLIGANMARGALSDKDAAEWDRAQKLSPAYAAGQIRVPLRRKADGSFDYVNIGNLVPAGDTAAFLRNLASGDMDKSLSENPIFGNEKTPVFTLVSEIRSGRDAVSNQKIEGDTGLALHVASKLLPPIVPPNYEGKRLLRSFTRNDEGGFGVVDSRTGRIETPGTALLRNVGVGVSQVQPRQLLIRAKADAQEKQRSIKSELNQLLRTNAAPEVKQDARQRALLKVRQVNEDYRRLLGP